MLNLGSFFYLLGCLIDCWVVESVSLVMTLSAFFFNSLSITNFSSAIAEPIVVFNTFFCGSVVDDCTLRCGVGVVRVSAVLASYA